MGGKFRAQKIARIHKRKKIEVVDLTEFFSGESNYLNAEKAEALCDVEKTRMECN